MIEVDSGQSKVFFFFSFLRIEGRDRTKVMIEIG